jgi:hypothetical protein
MAKKKSNREQAWEEVAQMEPWTGETRGDLHAGISLAGAQARLRDLIEEACGVLPVDLLSGISLSVAMFLDQHLNDRVPGKTKGTSDGTRIARLGAAEDAEKTEMGQWWQEFARNNADVHRAG